MVKGMTRELFYGTAETAGLAQCMSVYGDGKININTAPKPVLRALTPDITDEDVNQFDKYRRDPQTNLADAGWYQKIPRATALTIPAGLIKIKSEIFQITAVGLQGRMSERIIGAVSRNTGQRKVTLLSWKVE